MLGVRDRQRGRRQARAVPALDVGLRVVTVALRTFGAQRALGPVHGVVFSFSVPLVVFALAPPEDLRLALVYRPRPRRRADFVDGVAPQVEVAHRRPLVREVRIGDHDAAIPAVAMLLRDRRAGEAFGLLGGRHAPAARRHVWHEAGVRKRLFPDALRRGEQHEEAVVLACAVSRVQERRRREDATVQREQRHVRALEDHVLDEILSFVDIVPRPDAGCNRPLHFAPQSRLRRRVGRVGVQPPKLVGRRPPKARRGRVDARLLGRGGDAGYG
mmetsp:Transcript_11067/g.33302  ORF Transcript_11067/g.33302 Transcript_11067/m.33302 type:complete len:272 (+) Transcript_11067:908-1723(+)